jgi:hypothetical protein
MPSYPTVDESSARLHGAGWSLGEQALIEPILRTLADPAKHGLGAE